jgi:hypothetical protein
MKFFRRREKKADPETEQIRQKAHDSQAPAKAALTAYEEMARMNGWLKGKRNARRD